MAGVPCIKGTRIPVATVVAYVAEGQSPEDIGRTSRNSALRTLLRR